ncbi:adenosylcobinamide-GDP ribazoletransferase [Gordonia rhizosphera]|uniref:Adenosylcobinamide-GDP ribazoletransferase n=1 Tax=Gordonia rhizosphera NBRC 16068 TaxID=1108045 RepID=K6WNW1_9ACTN|nr:adenosylcobinamide-GDP ribazoletransferase [Gordonia rhizosphera]GAB88224.1 cobalamin synthase [Gordonia rhizosphera NBRC 16068]
MISPVRAVGVAFSWLTVVPIPKAANGTYGPIDRRLGGAVMSAVPVVGAVIGAATSLAAWALSHTDLPPTMIGVLLVAALALVTRGMHLDGLADTADGLGCYGPPERVTEVMRSGTVGPFGVATIAGVMIVQTVGFGALVDRGQWYALAFAIALGRVCAVLAARAGLSPAHPNGFGALVAGTQRASAVVWSALGFAAAALVGPDAVRALQAVAVTAVVFGFTWVFTRHCAKRMGGVSGDVLGAVIELATAITVVGLLA